MSNSKKLNLFVQDICIVWEQAEEWNQSQPNRLHIAQRGNRWYNACVFINLSLDKQQRFHQQDGNYDEVDLKPDLCDDQCGVGRQEPVSQAVLGGRVGHGRCPTFIPLQKFLNIHLTGDCVWLLNISQLCNNEQISGKNCSQEREKGWQEIHMN